MRVRIVMQQIVSDGIDDNARSLGATGAIEVGCGIIIVKAQQRRKLFANLFS